MTESSLLWFRRDLRTRDHPALAAAAGRGGRVLGVFVLDDRLVEPAGGPRLSFMYDCLRALDAQLGGRLLVVRGTPAEVVPALADAVGASSVHVSADCGPYGRERDRAVAAACAERGVELVRTGSPYAVTPGRVRKRDGDPFRVFTPFHRAWVEHGWRAPADTDAGCVEWLAPSVPGGPTAVPIPTASSDGAVLPEAGEEAALARWHDFRADGLAVYAESRDRPDRPGSSGMSPHLRWGTVHPRTLLADLPDAGGAETFRAELAWREFHADMLWHRPEVARRNYDPRFDRMDHESGAAADEAFEAWCAGRTGFPIVDAGMRQLLAEGWMHNRVRMVVASFLVKDLHLPWWRGARHFMRRLVDGDLASNQLNWQWVAGCGTDAAPYFRVFNPVTQGKKFDPDGAYVRRYVPELRDVAGGRGSRVHEPWLLPEGPLAGYPAPIVDHAHERRVALERYGAITG